MEKHNYNNASRRCYQSILKIKGKINIFSEYVGYYQTILSQKTLNKRQGLLDKHQVEVNKQEFYIKSEAEVFETLEKGVIQEKANKLNLVYREKREKNKRAMAKLAKKKHADPKKIEEKQAKFDQDLAALKQVLDQELADYANNLKSKVTVEKLNQKEEDYSEGLDNINTIFEAKLAKFDSQEQKKNERRYNNKKRQMDKKIARLQKKLQIKEAKLKEYNALEQASSPLKENEILKVDDLCMYFGGLHAVDHLNFEVKDGEIYGLIGPNGAGKTTVFNCITQFYKPTAGEITFRTKEDDIIHLNKEKVHDVITFGIARTFQNVEVIPECTVLENLLIAANRQYQSTLFDHLFHTRLLKLEDQVITQRALKVLQFMGLLPYAYNYAMGLPYGVLKKIEIARTLMTNAQLIILDEPAAGLNESETNELSKLIKQIRDEYRCTILLVEHDMGLVMNVCDRICAISFGKLLAIGTPEEIQNNKLVQEAYLGVNDEEE